MNEGLTDHQVAKQKLGVSHPAGQIMKLLERIEMLERNQINILCALKPEKLEEIETSGNPGKKSRSEAMKESWAKRKANQ